MFAAALSFLVLSVGISLVGFIVGSLGPADLDFVLSDVLIWSSVFAGVVLLFQRWLDYKFFSADSDFLTKAEKCAYTILGVLLILPVLAPTNQWWKLELGSYSFSLPYIHFTLEDFSAWVDQQWNALPVWLDEITVWLNQSNDFSIKNGLIVFSSVIGLMFFFLWIALLWSEFRGQNRTIRILSNEVNDLKRTNLQQSHDLEVAEAQIEDLMSQRRDDSCSSDSSHFIRENKDGLTETDFPPAGRSSWVNNPVLPGWLPKVRLEPGPEELRVLDRLSPDYKGPEEVSSLGEPKGWVDNIFEIDPIDERRSIFKSPVHDPGVVGYGSHPVDVRHISLALEGLRWPGEQDPETADLLAQIDREGLPEDSSDHNP